MLAITIVNKLIKWYAISSDVDAVFDNVVSV